MNEAMPEPIADLGVVAPPAIHDEVAMRARIAASIAHSERRPRGTRPLHWALQAAAAVILFVGGVSTGRLIWGSTSAATVVSTDGLVTSDRLDATLHCAACTVTLAGNANQLTWHGTVTVQALTPGGPAAAAGLQVGDELLTANARALTDPRGVSALTLLPEDAFALQFLRNGIVHAVQVPPQSVRIDRRVERVVIRHVDDNSLLSRLRSLLP
jgi:membrane-associated protease RseP (regulator of RpoE activity)